MTNRSAASGAMPADDDAGGPWRVLASLRADPRLRQVLRSTGTIVRGLATAARALARWALVVSVPVVCVLVPRISRRAIMLVREAWLRDVRRPEVPLYAAAAVVAVVAGWLVGHRA